MQEVLHSDAESIVYTGNEGPMLVVTSEVIKSRIQNGEDRIITHCFEAPRYLFAIVEVDEKDEQTGYEVHSYLTPRDCPSQFHFEVTDKNMGRVADRAEALSVYKGLCGYVLEE